MTFRDSLNSFCAAIVRRIRIWSTLNLRRRYGCFALVSDSRNSQRFHGFAHCAHPVRPSSVTSTKGRKTLPAAEIRHRQLDRNRGPVAPGKLASIFPRFWSSSPMRRTRSPVDPAQRDIGSGRRLADGHVAAWIATLGRWRVPMWVWVGTGSAAELRRPGRLAGVLGFPDRVIQPLCTVGHFDLRQI